MFWFTGGTGWATAATWLLGAGIATALLAALAGFTDFLANGEVRAITAAWQHMIGNLTAVFLVLINFLLRLGGGAEAVLPWGLLISTAVVLILLYTGWKGGHLVYQHRVGVNPPSEETH
ncbi:DUF2231 domain-containing protein [Chelativorans salis]|uniref:DUF2231 domain-containing protein n=1 Tax=Chelativorans salis TaxID=2978478 RepID=UPI0028CBB13B|nr:DUF2231 domain-containing protein [Chelativorans sp. EGI FJ00035]